jgi:lipopolysaccharide/colanic/teichoic acid biosynthesis glycosyltransferase
MTFAQVREPSDLRAPQPAISAGRIFDVILASCGLLVLAPIMLLVALAIWIDSGRPILFSQMRLGRRARPFRIYKFRKFHRESKASDWGVTIKGDSRLTRLGSVLARTKIDELPQLWNLLKGDMSIVGPRPESLKFADCFAGAYDKVLEYQPGIFGPNQFYFGDESSLYPDACDPERFYREVLFPVKANIDVGYFAARTVRGDIGWIIHGVLGVFGWRSLPAGVLSRLAAAFSDAGYGRAELQPQSSNK